MTIATEFKEGIKVKLHRSLESEIRHATVSMNRIVQYFVAILADVILSEQVKQVKYKANWYGRTLIKIDK